MAERTHPAPERVGIVRSEERFRTRNSWLDSRHSFSFGAHYDPTNTHFGLLLVCNDDIVAPGAGFAMHPHQDMEIITWVLDGTLSHTDSAGHAGTLRPGVAQWLSAGSGVQHAETNARTDQPVRFVQMWVAPDVDGMEPDYEQRDVGQRLADGDLIALASGRGHPWAIPIRQRDAVLHAARLPAGRAVPLPAAPFLHLYVARGRVGIGTEQLRAGDAARVLSSRGQSVTAVPGSEGAEILVWEMHAEL
ncbi:MAG: pirin family protein [Frankiaceae bacterium]